MNELFVELGKYLREKRKSCGLSQSQVAEHLGYSNPQFISNFERGLCAPPIPKLRILIKLYDLPKDEVIQLMVTQQKELWKRQLIDVDDFEESCGNEKDLDY